MFQMMGVFAEFERAMIRERVLAGLARRVRKAHSSAGAASRIPTPGRLRRSGRFAPRVLAFAGFLATSASEWGR